MTEQEDSRSTMSCTSQSNESDTDEMDMLAHSTIKQEEYTHNDDDDDDDTPYVPNNNNHTNSTSPTPLSFHDSDNKQNETSSEQDIPDADSLQNTPTDTLYETEEAITPTATLPKNDYFSDMTQPNPVTHNTHWEPAYITFMEQLDDNNKKQDLLEPDYPDLASRHTEEEGILEFRGLSTEITRDDKNEWYDNYKSTSSDKTIRSSISSSCKQSNSTENTNYNQEEEHFDYYSTKLHTDQPADSGEITVYLDRSSLQESRSNTDLQTLDFRNLSNISFNNNSNLTLSSSVSSTRSSVIADPTKPRIEDISYYMSTLPVFEKAAALIDDDQENTSSQRECANKEARGIPSAHEIYYGTLPSEVTAPNSNDSLPEESGKGKLYIGIRGAHNMLLPIPNELTYARCVISDGKYEYISRYEILGREILLDYEAVLDTLPGTIITVSLQVRPDYHVMPRTGISKFFTSARKQKEQLSGYVYAADGSISQTRFSVDAMMPKCYKKTYQSNFDCFNSWYTRTSQERARDPEEMLKIVGKLTVEMLYLPLKDETAVSQI